MLYILGVANRAHFEFISTLLLINSLEMGQMLDPLYLEAPLYFMLLNIQVLISRTALLYNFCSE